VLGKYLVSLAKAQEALRSKDGVNEKKASATCRKRLHILYLLNDLLHHTKYHIPNSSQFSAFSGFIQPFVLDLIQLASLENRPKIQTRIDSLLKVWEEEAYYSKDYVNKLREAATNSASGAANDTSTDHVALISRSTYAKEQPYVMPQSHGDPSTPYHDLPAGNMMPHILPNRPVPLRPEEIRALQFVAGPADDSLVVAVKDFLAAVEKIENHVDVRDDEGSVEDIDELGQPLIRDETRDLVAARTYYGWSHEFCDKMKSRVGKNYTRSGRERSYSSSSSRSRSPRKRRRYSNPASSRSASYSRSRSRNRSPHHNFKHGLREYTPTDREYPGSRPCSRSRTYPPAIAQSGTQPSAVTAPFYHMPSENARPPGCPLPVPPPPIISPPNVEFNQHPFPPPPLGPGSLPIPPPRPANFSGPWPPPPPLPSNVAFNTQPGMQPYHTPQGFPRPPPYQGGQQYGGSKGNKWQP